MYIISVEAGRKGGMSHVIRPVKTEDAAAICGIYNPYVVNTAVTFEESPVPVDQMEERIQKISARYPWFVWEEAGEILGYAYLHAWHERLAYRYSAEDSIYIRESCLGRGIGKALLAGLLEKARGMDIHVIMSVITVPNERSVGLHEKFGFKKTGHFKEIGYKLGRRLDVGYWEHILNP
jgi:phosphinothricin acetyltransferase